MTYGEACKLAKESEYAVTVEDTTEESPINWSDAGAFFLEGYEYRKREELRKICSQTQAEIFPAPGRDI